VLKPHPMNLRRRPMRLNLFRIGPIRAAMLMLAVMAGLTALGAAAQIAEPAAAPVSGGPVDPAILADLVVANHVLTDQGAMDAFGHVSIRHPTRPDRFLMSRSLAPALVTADDIVEYDLDGNPVDARGRASFLERFIHAEIYRARPDVQAVIHSHANAVIPFSVSKVPLRPVALVAAFLPQPVPVFEIRETAGMSNMLISTPELGRALARTLGSGSVALIRGHGMVVAASTLPLAVYRTIYTAVDATLEAQALTLGGPVTYLEPEEARATDMVVDQIHLRAWDLWKRQTLAKGEK
jgi:ribulose-5-phosphate 4-epimerase/fuculose-1-phosphate aldolase